MTWTRFEDTFYDHPKIVNLTQSAHTLFVNSIMYCNRFLTDGHIPREAPRFFYRYDDLDTASVELLDAGLWEQNGTGWYVHDYLEYQKSKEHILKKRQEAKERMFAFRSREQTENE